MIKKYNLVWVTTYDKEGGITYIPTNPNAEIILNIKTDNVCIEWGYALIHLPRRE